MARPAFRDLVRVEYNAAKESEQYPVWRPLISRLPCYIEAFTGREIEQGESIEADIDYRVHTSHNLEAGRIRADMRLCVIVGPVPNMTLYIVVARVMRAAGRDANLELLAREKEPHR